MHLLGCLEVLGKLYSQPEDYVEEASVVVFLRELRNFNEDLRTEEGLQRDS